MRVTCHMLCVPSPASPAMSWFDIALASSVTLLASSTGGLKRTSVSRRVRDERPLPARSP